MRTAIIALSIGLSLAAGAAMSQAATGPKAVVVAAKADGLVGEQGDGFLGLVSSSAPPAVKAAVEEINAGRAQAYKDIAAKTGVDVSAAGEATARQLEAKVPAGGYFKPLGGGWTKK